MKSYEHKYPKALEEFKLVGEEVKGGPGTRTADFHNKPGKTA